MSFYAVVTASLLMAGCDSTEPVSLRVMTRNVFLGADVERVMIAETPEAVLQGVEESYQIILATDWDERVEALAEEIAIVQPHLVGLQEISILRIQSPGDAVQGGTTPATTVLWDYLDDLLEALAAQGLTYTAVAMNENFDVEFPRANATFDDLRLTDYDVILALSGVQTSNPTDALYQAGIDLTTPLGPVRVNRGWSAVDVHLDGRTVRFVNTHLESFVQQLRQLQGAELVTRLATELNPIVLVGDLNTDAVTAEPTYAHFIESGYQDAWALALGSAPGLSCCQDEDLQNDVSAFDKRVDLILLKNFDETVEVTAQLMGDQVADKTPSGVWPSDHAGVVAVIVF